MINVGIIGSGVGVRTHLPAFRKMRSVFVKSIFSPNTAKLQEIARAHEIPVAAIDAEQIFDDKEISLVVIASPNSTHEKYVRRAVEARKHLLCEKPLGRNAAESRRIAECIPQQYPMWTGVNHQLRFNPYLRFIRELVATKTLGRVISARFAQQGTAFADPNFQWNWSFDEEAGGGVRLAMGSHLLDLAMFMLDRKIGRIDAHMDPISATRPLGDKQISVKASSTFIAFCEMEDGTNIQVSTNASAFSGVAFDIEIFLERGEIRFDLERKIRVFKLGESAPEIFVDLPGVTLEERANDVSIFSGSFIYFARKIVEDIDCGRLHTQDACSFEDAIYLSEVLDASLDSYRNGASVNLGKMGRWRESS